MNGITHKQAKDYIHAELDGLLTDIQRSGLDAHLRECEACRIEAESLSVLATRLKSSFHDRWDGQYGPSENVQLGVLSHRGRIIMSNRIRFGMRTLAGIGALVVLGLLINFAFAQLRNPSIVVSGTGTTNGVKPAEHLPLIAFTSEQNGNYEIYTVLADGTGLTNLTNDPAMDTGSYWSPDGTRLAFLSDRNGQLDIFTMKSDGSDLTQLTKSAENEFGFRWSPNGTQIAYYAASAQDPNLHDIIIMDADGSNKTVLTGEPGLYFFPNWLPDANWSLDGSRLVFLEQAGQSKKEVKTKYYVANSDGTNFQELAELDGTVFNSRWHGNHIIALMQHLTATGERKWELYRLSMDGAPPQKLASYDKRIVNWFGDLPDLTYIVETGPVTWSWFKTDGRESTPLNVWKNNFQNCRGFEVEMQVYDALSPGGEKLLVSSFCNEGDNWFYLVNTDGSEIKSLISEPISGQVFDQITWSPDGRYLVFGVFPDTSQNLNFDYYILNVADALADPTTRPSRLTADNTQNKGGAAFQPASNLISVEITPKPDNNVPHEGLIAFVSGSEAGNEEIYIMKADGSGLTNLTNNPATDTSPAWSPDGTRIAFNSDRNGDMDIYVMDADGSNVKRLTDDRGFEGLLSWSPDGQRIVFTASDNSLNYDGQLIVMDADGGNEIIISEPGTYYFLGWSPDGQKIIFEDFYENSKETRIVAASVDGTGAELLGPYFEGDNGRLHRQIHWEAPGQFVTISSNSSERPTWGRWNLTRFFTTGDYTDDNGSNPIIITQDYPIVAIFDKTFVVESTDSLSWFPYSGEPFPLSPWNFSERCTQAGESNLQGTEHTVSPSGKQAFVTVHCNEGVTWFYLENADGSQFVRLTDFSVTDPSQVVDTSWSPDEKFVTATIASSISRTMDIYLFDIEKMLNDPSIMPIQITTDGAWKYGAVWQPIPNNTIVEEKPTPEPTPTSSPEGLIAFASEISGNFEIYTIQADGSNVTEQTQGTAMNYGPAWSPDGKKIAFVSERTGNSYVFVMNPDGSNLTQLTDNTGKVIYFAWSPDGQKIVYITSDGSLDNDGQLIIMNADGSNKTTVTEPGSYIFLSWSPDGRKIIYQKQNLDESDKDAGTYIVEIDGTNQRKLSEIKEAQMISWADPQHFLVESFNNFSGGGGAEWSIYRYDTDGTLPLKISSFGIPIVALFENTYVVERQEALMWYPLEGASTPLSSWSLDEVCKTHTDPTWQETAHYISPDKKYSFVIAYCWNGPQSFLLINEDGTEFHQLGMPITGRPGSAIWSPDGKYVTVIIDRLKGDQSIGGDLYLFDFEKMLNDPSTMPIQLTTDGAWKDGGAWQPQP